MVGAVRVLAPARQPCRGLENTKASYMKAPAAGAGAETLPRFWLVFLGKRIGERSSHGLLDQPGDLPGRPRAELLLVGARFGGRPGLVAARAAVR